MNVFKSVMLAAAVGAVLGVASVGTVYAGAIGNKSGPLCEDFEKMGISPPADCVKADAKTRGLAIGGVPGQAAAPSAAMAPAAAAAPAAPARQNVQPAAVAAGPAASTVERGLADIKSELVALRQEQAQLRELISGGAGGGSAKEIARLDGRIDQINTLLKGLIEIKK